MDEPKTIPEMLAKQKLDGLRRENDRRIVERLPEILEKVALEAAVKALAIVKEAGLLRERPSRRPGPKGPRKHTAIRRAIINTMYGMGLRGYKICQQLQESKIPLPTGNLRFTFHEHGWVLWFKTQPKAVNRQFYADRSRFRSPKK
jgi:hypothetical protein